MGLGEVWFVGEAIALPKVHRFKSASGLIRQPQSQIHAQAKVGSERSREFSLFLSFDGQKKEKHSVSDTHRQVIQ